MDSAGKYRKLKSGDAIYCIAHDKTVGLTDDNGKHMRWSNGDDKKFFAYGFSATSFCLVAEMIAETNGLSLIKLNYTEGWRYRFE